MSKRIADIVREHVEPIVTSIECELVDVEFVKEGPDYFLRIYVDHEQGMDLDKCSEVSEKVSEKLDEIDPIDQEYILEVSSPGAERPLKKKEDFTRAIGRNVFVTLYEPINQAKAFEGILINFENEMITIQVTQKTRKKEIEIPFDKIASARLAILFS